MISVTQLRNGTFFLHRSDPHRVIEYSHTHMGRGGGTIRVKVRNLKTGATTHESFKSGDRVEDISINKKKLLYLYRDGDSAVCMDEQSYEQIAIPIATLGESIHFMKENEAVWLFTWESEAGEEILGIDLPPKVQLRVTEAAPGEKGNSASNMYKDGLLENGQKVRIPLFVNAGDEIIVSTTDGSYVERA